MNSARLVDRLLRLMAPLPLWLVHGLGTVIGTLALVIPNDARFVARVNTELCFPEWSRSRKRRLVRCALRESAKTLTELGALWYRPAERLGRLIRSVDGLDVLEAALADERGALIIAPHLGAWELLQADVARRTTLHALYRPPRQAALEELILKARSRTGGTFWPARGSGVRALFRALSQGHAVGVLPDQQPPDEGVFVPFFGVPAKTMTLFCKLAARSRARLVVGWAERLPWGRGYRIHWREADPAIADPDPVAGATAMNRTIEAAASELPCQYQWTYRRFSRQPEGTRNPYKRYRDGLTWVRPRP